MAVLRWAIMAMVTLCPVASFASGGDEALFPVWSVLFPSGHAGGYG